MFEKSIEAQLLKKRQQKPRKFTASIALATLSLLACVPSYLDNQQSLSPSPTPTPLAIPSPIALQSSSTATLPPPSPLVVKNRQLPSSKVLKRPARRGSGSLIISNGTSRDAYLKLVDPPSRKLVAAFYIKSNSTYTMKRIPDGVYQVLFVSGEDWDAKSQTFTRNANFSKFDRSLKFVTSRETRRRRIYTRYTIFSLTLHPVIGGDAKTSAVGEGEFANY